MRNIFNDAERYLNSVMRKSCSEKVEYRIDGVSRGNLVNSVIGRTVFRVNDVSGFSIRMESMDFIVRCDELKEEPKKGDTISRCGLLYEVFAPDDEPCWRFSGLENMAYRIHTRLLGKDEYYPLEVPDVQHC